MTDVRVTCINKPDRASQHERITHLGGGTWKWTAQQVIDSINTETNTFYVLDAQGHRSEIGVVKPTDGRDPYLRTYRNDKVKVTRRDHVKVTHPGLMSFSLVPNP